jgi:basic amino acid/polyamine antiporter, APA family
VGGAIWSSFLVSFLLALVTAFAYLELVTKYPRAAGAALYVHRAFHIGILSFMVTIAVMASGVTSASFAATRVGGRYWTGVFGTENPPTVLLLTSVFLLVNISVLVLRRDPVSRPGTLTATTGGPSVACG